MDNTKLLLEGLVKAVEYSSIAFKDIEYNKRVQSTLKALETALSLLQQITQSLRLKRDEETLHKWSHQIGGVIRELLTVAQITTYNEESLHKLILTLTKDIKEDVNKVKSNLESVIPEVLLDTVNVVRLNSKSGQYLFKVTLNGETIYCDTKLNVVKFKNSTVLYPTKISEHHTKVINMYQLLCKNISTDSVVYKKKDGKLIFKY